MLARITAHSAYTELPAGLQCTHNSASLLSACADYGDQFLIVLCFHNFDFLLSDEFLLRPSGHFSRSGFNAPPHAMTWSNVALTDFSCWAAGLKTLKFSKSVNMESKTWLCTVAICISASTRRSCSTARAPPAPP